MMEQTANSHYKYGVVFIAEGTYQPMIKVCKTLESCEVEFESVLKTQEIEYANKTFKVTTVFKVATEGTVYIDYEMLEKQRLKENAVIK